MYSWNGSQIVSPTDKSIQKHILANMEPWKTSWDTQIVKESSLVHDPLQETINSYMQQIYKDLISMHKLSNLAVPHAFVYSAMHGVGYNYILKAFEVAGLEILPVEEQKDPDPEFPTVKWVIVVYLQQYKSICLKIRFPNPEEGKSSLDLAIKTADLNKIPIILANDPDADRLAVAEKNEM